MKQSISAILIMSAALSAFASAPVFVSAPDLIPAPATNHSMTARHTLPAAERTVASDYDCNYYWLSSDGTISDTWETSMTEIVAGEAENEFILKNFLADTFRPEGGAEFSTDDIRVFYDPQYGSLSIPCGQPLFVRTEGDKEMQICIYSLRRGEKGWMLGLDGDMLLAPTATGFALAEISEVQGFYIGYYDESTKRFSGYGGVLYPDFCEFNGVMLYQVTADEDTEMMPFINNIYSEVTEPGLLSVRNFANFGYDVTVNFAYNLASGQACAVNPLLGVLYDTSGVQNPYYACDADAADGGTAVLDAEGRYALTADISTDALGNSLLTIPLWGAFMGERWLGLYGSTSVMLFFELPEPEAGNAPGLLIDAGAEPEYYNLQGCRLENPVPGNIVICRKGREVRKFLFVGE